MQDQDGGAPPLRRRARTPKVSRPKVHAQRELRRIVFRNSLEHRTDEKAVSAMGLREQRPQTRGECAGGQRPCPWVSCKYHLALSINPTSGAITVHFPDRDVWELSETCALDVAERGGVTLEEVGQLTNITRERVRQIEGKGMVLLRRNPVLRAVKEP